jgi:uncharacterized membrane protein YphA (DoxX/SURF4 family)
MRKNVPAAWWPIPLRLIVGYGFMAHGIAKLLRGAGAFASALHALGVPFPSATAVATIAIELACTCRMGSARSNSSRSPLRDHASDLPDTK